MSQKEFEGNLKLRLQSLWFELKKLYKLY